MIPKTRQKRKAFPSVRRRSTVARKNKSALHKIAKYAKFVMRAFAIAAFLVRLSLVFANKITEKGGIGKWTSKA